MSVLKELIPTDYRRVFWTLTSPEVRYRLERDPDYGFGHELFPSGIHEMHLNKCVPDCSFYEPTRRLTVFDILGDYRGYQRIGEHTKNWKEKGHYQRNEIHHKEDTTISQGILHKCSMYT